MSVFFCSKTNQTHQCIKYILFRNDTVRVLDGLSIRHHKFKAVHIATGICQRQSIYSRVSNRYLSKTIYSRVSNRYLSKTIYSRVSNRHLSKTIYLFQSKLYLVQSKATCFDQRVSTKENRSTPTPSVIRQQYLGGVYPL